MKCKLSYYIICIKVFHVNMVCFQIQLKSTFIQKVINFPGYRRKLTFSFFGALLFALRKQRSEIIKINRGRENITRNRCLCQVFVCKTVYINSLYVYFKIV